VGISDESLRARHDRLDGGPRRILGIAAPALGALLAEPVYVLIDTAAVGRLGALPLAGLAIGGLVLTQVSTQLTFLTYGTTARAARRFGAGDRPAAVAEGVQATWLAVSIGLGILLVVEMLAGPIVNGLAGSPDIADRALSWLRIAVLGAPPMLVGLAGNGWMRGVQITVRPLVYVVCGLMVSGVLCVLLVHGLAGAPRLGLAGSAVANVIGQLVTAALFFAALAGQRTSLRPDPAVLAAQLRFGRDLVARSLAFQACFLSAGAVAARFGAAAVGAHQMAIQLWSFVANGLDSLAMAAQALVGAALGAGRTTGAIELAWRITRWSLIFALLLAAVFAAGHDVIPRVFSTAPQVLDQARAAWWFLVVLIPLGGVVFALDGVLIGAGDAAFLRTTTLAAALIGFLPAIWLSLAFRWGLAGIWTGLLLFVVLRLVAVVIRTRSGKWLVTGVLPVSSESRGE
jgi:putative MATE family efflux protein